jgi:hypothetical protein
MQTVHAEKQHSTESIDFKTYRGSLFRPSSSIHCPYQLSSAHLSDHILSQSSNPVSHSPLDIFSSHTLQQYLVSCISSPNTHTHINLSVGIGHQHCCLLFPLTGGEDKGALRSVLHLRDPLGMHGYSSQFGLPSQFTSEITYNTITKAHFLCLYTIPEKSLNSTP